MDMKAFAFALLIAIITTTVVKASDDVKCHQWTDTDGRKRTSCEYRTDDDTNDRSRNDLGNG
jgi:hypothetical protein